MTNESLPTSRKLKRKIGFIVILILILNTILLWYFHAYEYKKREIVFEEKLKKEQKNYYYFKIKQQRLKCMTRTLMVAYDLSKWEAYYYCTLFDDFSLKYNVPWELFPAIMRVESNFNASVRSQADCIGLMQIKRTTGKDVADKLNIKFNDVTLWNDIINIVIGSTYLCEHIKKEGLREGVKRYLGGPDYKKSVKNNHGTRTYVKEYKTSVISEYEQLTLMFRGVVDELGYTYDEIYLVPHKEDTIPLIFTLFTDSVNTDTIKQ